MATTRAKRSPCYAHQHPADGGPPKRAFHTRRKAEGAVRTIKRSATRSERVPCRAYECKGCHRWFLTGEL